MKMSEEITELATALAKFQAKVSNPNNSKTADAGTFKYKYASLDEILNLVRPLLSEEGLSLIQSPVREEGLVGVKTLLLHTSGQHIEFEPVLMPLEKQSAQGVGAAITYSRRYSLSAILGIASEDDDDALSLEPKVDIGNKTTGSSGSPLSEAQIKRLYTLGSIAGYEKPVVDSHIKRTYNKVATELTREEYNTVCTGYEKSKGDK